MPSDIQDLLEQMKLAVKKTVIDQKIGIAFSGGVDSTLLAKLCNDLNYEITLLTIGLKDSHDILFAKKINEFLNYPHNILEIDNSTFPNIVSKIKNQIKTDNLSWNENSIAFYYVSKLAYSLGLKTIVTANGIDELFCGYNAYRDVFDNGEDEILHLINYKLDNELKMMMSINDVTSEFDVKLIQPFLFEDFVNYSKTIPLRHKITDSDDLVRKHIVRKSGLAFGIPEISANKRKKALQYGSKIHKAMKFTSFLNFFIYIIDNS